MTDTDTPRLKTDQHAMAERLRHARNNVGMGQADVARHLGVLPSVISRIECGHRQVSGRELAAFAKLYRRTPAWLLGTSDESPVEADVMAALSGLHPDDRAIVVQFAQFLSVQRQIKNSGIPLARTGPAPQR